MKKYKETYIIGIDHGYGNMKTVLLPDRCDRL